jgi:F-type H+-transporting ATPase subunit delta
MSDKGKPQQIKTRIPSVLEDPSTQAVAQVYAEAFLNAAKGDSAALLEEYQSFLNDVLPADKDFETLLDSGMVSRDQKAAVIEKVMTGRASETFASFLRVLARHDRLNLLRAIFARTQRLQEIRQGQRRVQITSATALSDSHQTTIRNRLKEVFQFEPILETRVDPSLLGGLLIQVGDTQYDSSLRTRMKDMRSRLRERSLHEIQSGRNRFSSPEGN